MCNKILFASIPSYQNRNNRVQIRTSVHRFRRQNNHKLNIHILACFWAFKHIAWLNLQIELVQLPFDHFKETWMGGLEVLFKNNVKPKTYCHSFWKLQNKRAKWALSWDCFVNFCFQGQKWTVKLYTVKVYYENSTKVGKKTKAHTNIGP